MSPTMLTGSKRDPGRTAAYRQAGYWGEATLLDAWSQSVLRHPEKVAVIDSHGARLTFAEADVTAARLATWLVAQGVQPGEVVSCQLPGWTEFLPIYIAALKTGAVFNPLTPGLRFREAAHVLERCASRVLFAPHRHRHFRHEDLALRLCDRLPGLQAVIVDKFGEGSGLPRLTDVLAASAPLDRADSQLRRKGLVQADDVAAVLFTSGSEGTPKGVMLSHNNMLFSESSFAAHLGITQFDTMLMPAPVTHATGFHHGVTMPLLMGTTTVLQDVFAAGPMLDLLEAHRCTVAMATPSFVHDMLAELETGPRDLSSLRFFLSGGAPLTQALIERAEHHGLLICNIYGSTESVPHTGSQLADTRENRLLTAGRAMPGIEVGVVDCHGTLLPPGHEGEEVSRGPQVFLGYLGQPELTDKVIDAAGWYRSGDRAVLGPGGHVRVTGRIKDVIIRGGVNISSLEVENVLLMHPKIREAAVVGMPDPRLGERICAYVVLRKPEAGLTFAELCAFMERQDIMKQKFPERLEVVKVLPRTASGKVRKAWLRLEVARRLRREAASEAARQSASVAS